MIEDLKVLRYEWRLCKVVKAHPAENNVVRNVEVEVSARYDGALHYKHQKP